MPTRVEMDQLDDKALINFCFLHLDKKEIDDPTLHFLTFFLFAVEEKFTTFLIDVLTKGFKDEQKGKQIENTAVRELHLLGKIKVFEAITSDIEARKGDRKDYREFIKFLKKINEIRNSLFHGKFDDLRYKGKLISNISTRRDMTFDYLDLLHKAATPNR